jgi:hypothetical protein
VDDHSPQFWVHLRPPSTDLQDGEERTACERECSILLRETSENGTSARPARSCPIIESWQLADQSATLISRAEAVVGFKALGDKLYDESTRTATRFSDTARRLDLAAGKDASTAANQARVHSLIAGIGGIIGILLGMVHLIAVFRV